MWANAGYGSDEGGWYKNKVVSAAVFNITYGAESEDNSGATSYTRTGVSIGSADPNRYVIVAVGIRSASAIFTPTVTVDPGDGGGARTATKVIESINGAGPATYSALFQVPTACATGTTATVVVSAFGSAAARMAIETYSVVTNTATIPSGGAVSALAISGNNNTGSITVPTSGRSIVAGLGSAVTAAGSSVTAPASNFTTDNLTLIGGSGTTPTFSGHDTANQGATPTYTINWSGSAASCAAVAAAWAP